MRPHLVALTAAALVLTSATAASAERGAPGPTTPSTDVPRVVTATTETPALFDDEAGGEADADDPAIWVDPRDAAASLVIGTAKTGGLRVYDLAGRELQSVAAPPAPGPDAAPGRFNNVDVVLGMKLDGRKVDVAVVTDRGRDRLRFYAIDPTAVAAGRAPLRDVTAADVPLLFSADEAAVDEQATGYGLATYSDDGRHYAVVSRRSTSDLGLVQLHSARGRLSYAVEDTLTLPSTFTLPDETSWSPCVEPGEGPQVEGMVVDTAARVLYAAQEDVGLWALRLDVDREEFRTGPRDQRLVETVAEYGVPATFDPATEECVVGDEDPGFGGRIRADVEGLTIYPTGRRDGYLLVSSQGDNRFYAYDRRTTEPVGSFVVGDGPTVDGAEHSDGAAAVNASLPGYPQGLLVVHDGENGPAELDADGEARPNANFKYVDWRALGLPGR
ncbi:phytase [Cellulomonas cellasea]|uniref:Hydrolase n=2 Tax=Cellulomonas cellasea TaxID=43670 RepID=A0A0A0BCX9_9CELL|nr:phytase [Cellulomonas cellasea]KGM03759.1 hydrolase [Cellulomonas cellasea DSM 20118]GEA86870.1 hydrolase [Cellulomonas cellasea]